MKTNQYIRKLLAVLLCICMVASNFSVGVLAANEGNEDVYPYNYPNDNPNSEPTDQVTLLAGNHEELRGSSVDETLQNYKKMFLLGVVADFCVFLKEDLEVKESDTEGRVAVGGDIIVSVPDNWDGYVIGAGDYGHLIPLDTLLGNRKGAATIILGGKLEKKGITDRHYLEGGGYDNNNKSSKILVLNRQQLNDNDLLANIPSYSPPGESSLVDQTQTYVTELLDFDDIYEDLIETSKDLSEQVDTPRVIRLNSASDDDKAKLAGLLNKIGNDSNLDELKNKLNYSGDPVASDDDENLVVWDEDTHTIWFVYGGDPSDTVDSVYFNISEDDYYCFRDSSNFRYVNIPKLESGSREVIDNTGTSTKWEYAYIIVNLEGKPNEDDGKVHVTNLGIGNGDNKTYINGIEISNTGEVVDNRQISNNHPGVTSLLYNYYTKEELVLGKNFSGTIFAPLSDVTDEASLGDPIQRGHLSGALIANSFSGYTEFGYRPFSGTVAAIKLNEIEYSVGLIKNDDDGQAVKGADIGLYEAKDDGTKGTKLVQKTTGDSGKLTFDGLTAGKYILREIKAPTGYKIADDIAFTITENEVTLSADDLYGGYTTTANTYDWATVEEALKGAGIDDVDTASKDEVEAKLEELGYVAAEAPPADTTYAWGWSDTEQTIGSIYWFQSDNSTVDFTIKGYTFTYSDGYSQEITLNEPMTIASREYGENDSYSIITQAPDRQSGIVSISFDIKANNSSTTSVSFQVKNNSWSTFATVKVDLTEDFQVKQVFPEESDTYTPVTKYYKESTQSADADDAIAVTLPGGATATVEATKTENGRKSVSATSMKATLNYTGGSCSPFDPLNVTDNEYVVKNDGTYTFKDVNSVEDFKVYKNGEEVQDHNFVLVAVDGGYVVLTKTETLATSNDRETLNVNYKVVTPTLPETVDFGTIYEFEMIDDRSDATTGDLEVTKIVKNKNGDEPTDTQKDLDFEFTVTLTPLTGVTLAASYTGVLTYTDDEDGEQTKDQTLTVTNGQITFSLKHGQKMTIKDLPNGTTYEVTETGKAGYTSSPVSGYKGSISAGASAAADFINTYSLAPTSATPAVTKKLTGRTLANGEFTFEMTITGGPTDGYTYKGTTDENGIITATNDKDGNVKFGEIEFTKAGTYTVTITEQIPENNSNNVVNGVTYTNKKVVFEYVVVDDGEGNLSIDAAKSSIPANDGIVFTNTYSAKLISATPVVTKKLTGRALANGEFTFEMTITGNPTDGYTYKGTTDENGTIIATNVGEGEGNVKFGEIEFTKAGTYTVTIKEQIPENDSNNVVNGVTYTDKEVVFKYVVVDDGKGNLSIDTENSTIPANDGIVFTNTYSAKLISATPAVTKKLTGRALADGEFTFEMTITGNPADGYTYTGSETATNDEDGNVKFGKIEFTKAGTYTVTIKEQIPENDSNNVVNGVTYTEDEVVFKYVVVDDGKGNLSIDAAKSSIPTNDGIVFINTYTAPGTVGLTVRKTVTGNAGDKEKEFNFTVTLSDQSISGTYGDMTFSNGVATFTLKHGEFKTASNLPIGTTYEVTEAEANKDGYTTTVTGQNDAGTINSGSVTVEFVNDKNEFGSLTVSKNVVNEDGSELTDDQKALEFEFTVTLDDDSINGNYGDMTFKDGVATFALKHDESKTATDLPAGIGYTVTEEAVEGYTTTSNGEEGTIEADETAEVEFVNSKDTVEEEEDEEFGDLKVSKTVTGTAGDPIRNFTFTVTLSDKTIDGTYGDMTFKDGVATFALKHGESKTATGLPAGITYEVTETEANKDGYTTTVTGADGTITNGTAAASFVNHKDAVEEEEDEEFGDLKVSKTVTGTAGDKSKAFTFTVNLSDKSINGTYGDMTFSNGVATFTLKHGESKTATGLPAEIGYMVSETEANQDGYTTTAAGEVGTIETGETIEAEFFNNKDTAEDDGEEAGGEENEEEGEDGEKEEEVLGSLKVGKSVSGTASDKSKAFTFTVTLSDKSINGTYGDMTFKDGVATFTLKHGETKTAAKLPAGITYQVTETDSEGYTVSSSGENGTIPANGTAIVAFHNAKNTEESTDSDQSDDGGPETGDNNHLVIWLFTAAISLMGIAVLLIIPGKKRGKHYR